MIYKDMQRVTIESGQPDVENVTCAKPGVFRVTHSNRPTAQKLQTRNVINECDINAATVGRLIMNDTIIESTKRSRIEERRENVLVFDFRDAENAQSTPLRQRENGFIQIVALGIETLLRPMLHTGFGIFVVTAR